MSARRPLLRLPLTGNHKHLRHQWCDERRAWTSESNDNMFTDESRLPMQYHEGRIRVWRNRGERLLNCCVMHHHTGSAPGIMVWGVRSNSWDAQLAVPNDPRYARFEANLGIGQDKEARRRMVREDTGAPSEGATCAWMAVDEAVGCTRAFLTMWRSSRRLVCRGRPEPGLRVNDIPRIHWSQLLLTTQSEPPN
ncbi:transposable element Tcb1 transposase [Trichonephila clavipes]|nr:transposable element Tcb1 transposase [Trichonephila clavipes]